MGSIVAGVRCENLEKMTFANESIDLHITQDVVEHVFHPSKVWKEIERTLKPGGAHVFTVPIVNKTDPSRLRAKMGENGQITHLYPALYHGNPISKEGTLVTIDWGFDICNHIFESCGLFTHIFHIDDISQGIRSEYIEVLVTYKPLNTTPTQEIP
jgi:SAM-dependent methyltransferase